MKHPWLEEEYSNAIAVVGMAGRFCKSPDLVTFWHNLCAGFEAARRLSEEELVANGCSRAYASHPAFVPVCAQMEDVDKFDAPFFGLSMSEAQDMDPQLRLMLETSWHAFEQAGYAPDRVEDGSVRVGVFAGAAPSSYWLCNVGPNAFNNTGTAFHKTAIVNGQDFLSSWISYKFGFTGPSLNIQTACSTGLVLVASACQHLLDFSCDVALAATASVINPRGWGYVAESGGILSPDGHCHPFDVAACGTLPGEGACAVVLKRLEDALMAGDRIEAVIRGYGVSNDGSHRAGFAAPSAEGQALALRLAQSMAGVDSGDIGYVEAHGTGTYLGDPIEIAGLSKVFAPRKSPCPIGSLKGNLGHLGNAAGMASLLKVILMLKHGHIPPTINFRSLNPALRMDTTRFRIACENEPWTGTGPRLAGISAFGFGGTNCHLVVEETPPWARDAAVYRASVRENPDTGPSLAEDARKANAVLMFSAPDHEGLARSLTLWGEYLLSNTELSLPEVAWNLRHGRSLFPCRCALAGNDRLAMARTLLHGSKTLPRLSAGQSMAGEEGLYAGHTSGRSALVLALHGDVNARQAGELAGFLVQCAVPPRLVLVEERADRELVRLLEELLPDTCAIAHGREQANLATPADLVQGAEPVLLWVAMDRDTRVELPAREDTGDFVARFPVWKELEGLFGERGRELALRMAPDAPLPLASLGAALFAAGLNPVLARHDARRLSLPLYPFARISYWLSLRQETQEDASCAQDKAASGNQQEEASPEELVLNIWRAAFEIPDLGLDDDFYALGGSSMTAVEILTEVESVFGLRVSMNRFNSIRTARQLLKVLNRMAEEA